MKESTLIPIFSGSLNNSEPVLLCDARVLHGFLQVKSKFIDWIKNRIDEYNFTETEDFLVVAGFASKNLEAKPDARGGHNRIEYHITLDMAKELSMVERNAQGKAARRYFIECEKRLRNKALESGRAFLEQSDSSLLVLHKDGEITYEYLQYLHEEQVKLVAGALETLREPLLQLNAPAGEKIHAYMPVGNEIIRMMKLLLSACRRD